VLLASVLTKTTLGVARIFAVGCRFIFKFGVLLWKTENISGTSLFSEKKFLDFFVFENGIFRCILPVTAKPKR